ncbi:serine protease [Actinoplanes oblitus]|uniref:Serine protease n=1 Tax=Actinoplanes oblitus TaxID=3040509 RepID=A0ABY8W9Z1_9ACTN|nr:serine protease [Actinoplanes oblitus]WIM92550.1 serine protease [Actinoplanes oblitus]
MDQHPARERLAEIAVRRPGEPMARGSGYLVAPGWVLTAYHVVAGARAAGVWLGAPARLDPGAGLPVDLDQVVAAPWADLALVPVPGLTGGDPVIFGRVRRSAPNEIPVAAVGFPRFKLRPGAASDDLVRDHRHALGTIAPASNYKTGTLELRVDAAPADHPGDPHSPWEGMSGGPVWSGQRLLGVVGQHHPAEGAGVLTVRPLANLYAGADAAAIARWRQALAHLPESVDGLVPIDPPSLRQSEVRRAQRVAGRLAPVYLLSREREQDELRTLAASDTAWRWIVAEAYAGKTALLAWFTLRPPPEIEVASCFLRRPTGENTAEYALDLLTRQLAAIAGRPEYRPSHYLADLVDDLLVLLPEAAAAVRQRGQRLMLVVDGLDEYDTTRGGLDWLPDRTSLPAGVTLVAASRSGATVELPADHPLRHHQTPIAPAEIANDMHEVVRAEIDRIRTHPGGHLSPILSCLAMSYTGLSAAELEEILRRRGRDFDVSEIEESLRHGLGRSVIEIADPEGGPMSVFVFAHDRLLVEAQHRFTGDLPRYYQLLDGWADEYTGRHWPLATPRYLLRPYARQLAERVRDTTAPTERRRAALDRLFALVADRDRLLRLFEYVGNPAAPDADIAAAQQIIVDFGAGLGLDPAEMSFRLAALALRRQPLTTTRAGVASAIARTWARTGRSPAAVALATGIDDPLERGMALADVARLLAARGDVEPALRALAELGGHPDAETVARDVATGLAETSAEPEAYAIATQIADRWLRALALADVAERLCADRPDLAAAAVDKAGADVPALADPVRQAQVVDRMVRALIGLGDAAKAADLVTTVSTRWPAYLAAISLAGLAAALAARSGPDLVERVVRLAVARATGRPADEDRAFAAAARALAEAGRTAPAVRLAGRVIDPVGRIETLAGLLRSAPAGDPALGSEIARIAPAIPSDTAERLALMDAFGRLAHAFAEAGRDRDAARLIDEMVAAPRDATPEDEVATLVAAVRPLVRAGYQEKAAATAQRAVDLVYQIKDRSTRIRMLGSALDALAHAGRPVEAMAEVKRLDDHWQRAKVITEVAISYARDGEPGRAYEMVDRIDAADRRIHGLGVLACSLREQRRADEAARAVDRAHRLALEITSSTDRATRLAELAAQLAAGGLETEAAPIAESAVRAAEDEQRPDTRNRLLGTVSTTLAQAGWFALALRAAAALPESSARERSIDVLARAAAAAGRPETAIAAARQVTGDEYRAMVLSHVALGLAQSGHRQAAEATADEAVQAMMGTYHWRDPEIIGAVTIRLAEAGYLDQARTAVEWIDDLALRAESYGRLARALAAAGRTDEANAAATAAATVAGAIYDPQRRAGTLADLTVALARAGQDRPAGRTMAQALQAVAAIADPSQRTHAVRRLSLDLARAGQAGLARTAVGAATERTDRDDLFAEVARALADGGHPAAALDTATLIDDPGHRAIASLGLATGPPTDQHAVTSPPHPTDQRTAIPLPQAGQRTAPSPPQAGQRTAASPPQAIGQRAEQLAVAGRAATLAVRSATEQSDVASRVSTLTRIATGLADAGLAEPASEAAELAQAAVLRFAQLTQRAHGMCALAHAFQHPSITANGAAASAEALRLARQPREPHERALLLSNVARQLSVAGRPEPARKALDEAIQAAGQIIDLPTRAEMNSHVRRTERDVATIIATRTGAGGRSTPMTRESLRPAPSATAPPPEPSSTSSPFATLASLCRSKPEIEVRRLVTAAARPDSTDSSDSRANQSANAAGSKASPSARTADSATGQSARDSESAASQSADAAARSAADLRGPRRVDILSAVARCLAALGHAEAARAAASAMPLPHRRTVVLAAVAATLAAGGQGDAAVRTAEAITDGVARCATLTDITRDLHTIGRTEQAAHAAREALTAGDTITDPADRCDALLRLAAVLHEAGATQQAALAGARILLAGDAIGSPETQCRILRELTRLEQRAAHDAGAARAARRAVAAARRIGDPERQAAVLAELMSLDGTTHDTTDGDTALEMLLLTPTATNHLAKFPVDLLAHLVARAELA